MWAPRLCFSLTLLSLVVVPIRAHFSSPRVIGVRSRRETPLPRLSGPFSARSRLFAEAVLEEEEEEEVPDHFQEVVEVSPSAESGKKTKSFKELGFGGKLVRGTKNLITVTTLNFALGVGFGLITAGIRGFPHLMTRKEGLLGTPWKEEIPMRWRRYSGKCYRWARIWGPVFAIWGFADTMTTILRNGDNDEFNFMIASASAAVWHNRDKSIKRKCVVAVVYAVLTYGYVKFNEYYVVGPEGWQEKYNRSDDGNVASAAVKEGISG